MPFIMTPLETEAFNAAEAATVRVIDEYGRNFTPFVRNIVEGAVTFVIKNEMTIEPFSPHFVDEYQANPRAQQVLGTVANYLLANHTEGENVIGDEGLLRLLRVVHLWNVAGCQNAA